MTLRSLLAGLPLAVVPRSLLHPSAWAGRRASPPNVSGRPQSPSGGLTEPSAISWPLDMTLDRRGDIILWRRVTVAGWVTVAGRRGLYAEDATYDVIDWQRDADDDYAGTVRIAGEELDLILEHGEVRPCVDGRYGL